jgi:hypothetical protein
MEIPMRFAPIVVLALIGLTSPVLADDAADLTAAKATIAGAKLSATSDLDMWCGAAMTLVAAATKDSDASKSSAADASASDFFGKASASMTADGVKSDGFPAISTAYMTVANAELIAQTEAPSHSPDDCTGN